VDSKEPALTHLRVLVAALAERAGAGSVVLFVPRDAGPALIAYHDVNQSALDIAHSVWARRREDLRAGRIVPYGHAAVWPLFDGPELAAFLYLDRIPADFPDDDSRAHAADITARLRRLVVPSRVATYLATGLSLAEAADEVERDRLVMALDLCGGNVAAAARHLGIARETLYKRAHRLDVEIRKLRQRRLGRA
jgi:hypothetical protein